MQEYKIEVQKRDISNKKSSIKELRNADQIPGVYYSHDSKSSIALSIDKKMLNEALKSSSQVYKISVGEKKKDVIIKSIQYHPISENILHIDLYGVKMDTQVTIKVPISFIGECEGVKAGGVLNQNLTELDISCLPADIPQSIDIDISNLNIGDSIRVEQVEVDDKLKLVGDTGLLITSVIMPTKEEEQPIEEVVDILSDEASEEASDSTEDSEKETSE